MAKGHYITYNAHDLMRLLSAIPEDERLNTYLAVASGKTGRPRQVFSAQVIQTKDGKKKLVLRGENGRTPRSSNPIYEKIIRAHSEGVHPYQDLATKEK